MVHATPTKPITVPAARSGSEDRLEADLQVALEHARRLTELYGTTGRPEVAVAWDTVEELLTAKARRREQSPTTFQTYCSRYPDAPECRIYDT